MPATLSLLTTVFPDPRERGRAIGIWAAVAGASSGLGPVLGGLLLQHFSWRSVFLINVPVVIFTLVVGSRLLPTSRDPEAPRLDSSASGLSIVGLMVLLWAVIEAPIKGWTDPTVVAALGIGCGRHGRLRALGAGLESPRCSTSASSRTRGSPRPTSSITLLFFAMFGQMFLGHPVPAVGARLQRPRSRACASCPMALLLLVVAPLAPRLVERIGTKLVVGCGMLVGAVGLVIIATVPATDGYPHLFLGFAIGTTGMALCMAPATESIMGSLPPAKAGVGSAMNDTTRQMGGALGVAVHRLDLRQRLPARRLRPPRRPRAERQPAGHRRRTPSAGRSRWRRELPGQAGDAVDCARPGSFVDGMQVALLVALVAVLAAAVRRLRLPPRPGARRPRRRCPVRSTGLASATFAEAEGQLERRGRGGHGSAHRRDRRAEATS